MNELGPVQLALLGLGFFLVGGFGVVLVRDPGPLAPVEALPDDDRSVFERFVRSLGRPFVRFTHYPRARVYRTTVETWLATAGQTTVSSVDDFAEMHFGLIVLSGISLVWFYVTGLLQFGLLVFLVAALLPLYRLLRDSRLRQAAIEREMPPFLELMAVLLASGMTFRHALTRVSARLDGALAEEMRMLLNQLEYGYTPRDALDDLLRRSTAPTVKRLVASVRQNDELGVPISDTLSTMAEDVRTEAVVNLKIRAQNAADRAAVVLVFLAIPGSLGIAMTVLVSEAIDSFSQLGG
jgi:tight adherence protein C